MRTLPVLALLTALFLGLPAPMRAQEKESNLAQAPALSGLASRIAAARPNGGTATRFKPNGKRITLDARVNALAGSDDEKTSLRQLFLELFKGYEAEAKKGGFENDVAAAIAFHLVTHYSAYHGSDPGDDAMATLVKQVQSALDTPEMRAASDEDKQKLYEYCVMTGGLTLAMTEHAKENNDADMRKKVRQIGADGLRTVLSASPERVKITKAGMSIAPEARTAESRPPAAAAPPARDGATYSVNAVSYRLPAGWTEKKGEVVTLQRAFRDDYTNDVTTLLIVPGWAKSGTVQTEFPQAWRDLILSSFTIDEAQSTFVYSRRLGGGMNCAFSFANGKAKSNGAYTTVFLYLVDTGKAVYPIIGMFNGNQSKFIADVEQVLTSLRIAGASPAGPLFTTADLVGEWSTSDRTYASYVNSRGDYRGDASSAYSVALTLRADGRYSSNFMAVRAGSTSAVREKESGTFKIEGDMLVFYTASGAPLRKERILGVTPLPDGKGKMLILLDPQYPLLSGNIGLYGNKYILAVK